MFKPGELAGIRGEEARLVRVLEGAVGKSPHRWPVLTSAGVLDEAQLYVAHPTVIATARAEEERPIEALIRKREEGLSWELRSEVETLLRKTSVEWSGHFKNGADVDKRFLADVMSHLFFFGDMSTPDADALIEVAKNGVALDRWIPVPVSEFRSGAFRLCGQCGQSFKPETNGLVLRLGGPCEFPEGLPPTEWELNVPSGKLVVVNDLRNLFPLPEDEDYDVNYAINRRKTSLAYAANGLAHASVGNTSPGVYRCKDGTYKVATEPSDSRWDEETEEWIAIDPPISFDGEGLARICTDLWWYSICDYDEHQRRRARFKDRERDEAIVDVAPGVYRFRHDENADRYSDGECVFTRFERVRDADPVKDFLGQYDAVDVNAHAYVQAQVQSWPTLYGQGSEENPIPWADMSPEARTSSWARVADRVLCTSGGEWHERGFVRATVDPNITDVEPPTFREQHHWYPFSEEYGALFNVKFSPSFARLAFRVLESIISFGMTVRDDSHSREVQGTRERMLLAVKRYRQLAKVHPTVADPQYVAWLKQKGRAEAWVERFELGPVTTKKHVEHAQKQRWVPEDAYAVAFDARILDSGHFAWHPKKGGCWAAKEDAQRYALEAHADNGREGARNCFWACNASKTTVPLYSVARVVKVGEVSHMGETLVELSYDYGTPWMRDASKRKAVAENKGPNAIRVVTKEEYETLLPEAIKFYEDAEAAVEAHDRVSPRL